MNTVLKLLLRTLEAAPISSLTEEEREALAWLRDLDRRAQEQPGEVAW